MAFFFENPMIMVIALVLASMLGGVGGFILRGWYDDATPREDGDRRRPDPGTDGSSGPWGGVRRTTVPAGQPEEKSWWSAARRGNLVGAAPGEATEDGPLVLLVDDRLELLALHSAYLHEHGYQVLTAGDGDTALEYARSHQPDVMVIDHSMPRRTGLEVVRELKGDSRTADIPILMMTAHSYGAVGNAAMEAGCETFLPKPVDPSRMLREVSVWAPIAGVAGS